jgi:hypothetical protein
MPTMNWPPAVRALVVATEALTPNSYLVRALILEKTPLLAAQYDQISLLRDKTKTRIAWLDRRENTPRNGKINRCLIGPPQALVDDRPQESTGDQAWLLQQGCIEIGKRIVITPKPEPDKSTAVQNLCGIFT